MPYREKAMKHKNLVSTTGKFMYQSMMPVSVVDDKRFRQLIHTAGSGNILGFKISKYKQFPFYIVVL